MLWLSQSFLLFLSILGHTATVQDPGEEDGGADRVCSSEWRDAEVLPHCSPPHISQPLQPLYRSESHQVTQYMDVHVQYSPQSKFNRRAWCGWSL
jgi:hypothetical protein